MDIVQIYIITTGSVFAALIILNLLRHATRVVDGASLFVRKYLTYPFLLRRHHYAGPWSPAEILLQLSYITIIAFCLGFQTTSLSAIGRRSGYLALVNLIPQFAGPHLSFLADLLGLPLSIYGVLHLTVGVMSYALLLLHVGTVMVKRQAFPLHSPKYLYGVIVCFHFLSYRM
jgi:hypothetical protein